jgi:voltage-gated potassium channel
MWELPYEFTTGIDTMDMRDYGSAIWLVVITSTTVGYGDIYPHTIGGQITCVITAFWGTFIISLLVLVISRVFKLEECE